MPRLCSIPDCGKPFEARGYCPMHYQRWRKYGDPNTVGLDYNAERRFHANIVVDANGCWIWQARDINQWGHARWMVGGKRVGVHRWAYERWIGSIPDGLVIDHLCRVPACVNLEHLEPVTQPENVMRAPTAVTTINAKKTHCIHGHAFEGSNLIWRKNGERPCRQCRACTNRRAREYQQRRRAA